MIAARTLMADDAGGSPLTRADLERMLRQAFPDPQNHPFTPEDSLRRVERTVLEQVERSLFGGEEQAIKFAPHVRRLLRALSEDDVRRLESVLGLSPKTLAWIGEKNERELKALDDAVEFISSTRTAARVLMYVVGTAVSALIAAWTLAKNGYDALSLLRGGK